MDVFAITSITQIALCVIFALFVLIRNFRSLVNISFSIGMVSLALLVFGDYMSIQDSWNAIAWKRLSMIGESLFPMSWLLFSSGYGSSESRSGRILLAVLAIAGAGGLTFAALYYPTLGFMYSPELITERIIYLNAPGFYFYMVLVMVAIIALVRLESVLWLSRGGTRWKVKYAVVGAAGLLGMFIYYYSQSILYRSIDMNLAEVRNAVFLISTVLLAAAFVRQQFLDVDVFVSRRMIFRSASLLVVGIYFIFLGIIGEGMRYFGEGVSRRIMLFLVFAGTIGLSVLFLTEGFRRRAKRFITDNFYRNRYEYKDEWMKFTETLAGASGMSGIIDVILGIMVEAFGVRSAYYWACGADMQPARCIRSSSPGFPPPNTEIPADSPLIRLMRAGKIYDTGSPDPEIESAHHDLLTSTETGVVIPVFTVERLLGFVVLGGNIARASYDYEDYELMLTFSRQGAYSIERSALSDSLTAAREMEAMGKVASFVMHDLKNMTTSMSMLLENAEHFIGHPDFQRDMLGTIRSLVDRMSSVMRKLSHLREQQDVRMASERLSVIAREVIRTLSIPREIELVFREHQDTPVPCDREQMKKVLVNLIINAVESMKQRGSGRITLDVSESGGDVCASVSDTGCGMSRDFIERELFRPFHTTKNGGLGIGLYHCRSIVESHGGRFTVESAPGEGSKFGIHCR
jgi:putative PEP-CTERM system histidine kinase